GLARLRAGLPLLRLSLFARLGPGDRRRRAPGCAGAAHAARTPASDPALLGAERARAEGGIRHLRGAGRVLVRLPLLRGLPPGARAQPAEELGGADRDRRPRRRPRRDPGAPRLLRDEGVAGDSLHRTGPDRARARDRVPADEALAAARAAGPGG